MKWPEELINKLMELTKKYEEKQETIDWEEIAKQLNRNPSQCYNKYTEKTDPDWTDEEKKIMLDWWDENNDN